MTIKKILTLLVTAALLALVPQLSRAHEGHDHDAETKASSVPAAPRAEGASNAFELVAVAQNGELIIYLDRFATNEPVSDAALAVETPAGSVEAKFTPDGTYRLPAPWAQSAGRYNLIFTVTKGEIADVLPLTLELAAATAPGFAQTGWRLASSGWGGEFIIFVIAAVAGGTGFVLGRRRSVAALLLVVGFGALMTEGVRAHEGEDHGTQAATPKAARDVAQQLGDDTIFVPKSTQRILAIRTQIAQADNYRRGVELPGRIIPDPNASGYVQASVGGRLSPPEGGFPRLGTAVKKGDVLAYVTPPMQAIDASDMRQRQGELDQQINIVERRLKRYETLAQSSAIPKSQYDDTKFELEGLLDRRAALDKSRREVEALVAPVDGVVADGSPVAGQIAQTNAVIFQIVDPSKLWIEALSYDVLPGLQKAVARLGGKELSLSFRGAGLADRNQSIPIHFAIQRDVSGLRAGQFVTVLAETAETQSGVAVPRASVVRNSSGQDVVYEHVTAERFQPRPIKLEPLDSERVLIAQGLKPGTRIVVQGAELLDHIR